MRKNPHNQPNNINTHTLDIESDITNHGKHNRLLVFGLPLKQMVEIREDIIPNRGLATATPAQRLKAANGWQRQHPKGTQLRYIGSTKPYPSFNGSHMSIDHTYQIERKGQTQ